MLMARAADAATATAMICTVELAVPCNHVAKLISTELPHATQEVDKMVSPYFAMIYTASSSCRYVAMSRNRYVTSCQHDGERIGRRTSLPLVVRMSGIRRSESPSAASTYMFYVTDRLGQGADKVRCRQTRDKKPTNGG